MSLLTRKETSQEKMLQKGGHMMNKINTFQSIKYIKMLTQRGPMTNGDISTCFCIQNQSASPSRPLHSWGGEADSCCPLNAFHACILADLCIIDKPSVTRRSRSHCLPLISFMSLFLA